MKINLFAVCKSVTFIGCMKQLFARESIFISGICNHLSQGLIEYKNLDRRPDVVLLDAFWSNDTSKDLLKQFLEIDVKVILVTTFPYPKIVDYFLPYHPHGYFYRTCEDYRIITNCIRQVFEKQGGWSTIS